VTAYSCKLQQSISGRHEEKFFQCRFSQTAGRGAGFNRISTSDLNGHGLPGKLIVERHGKETASPFNSAVCDSARRRKILSFSLAEATKHSHGTASMTRAYGTAQKQGGQQSVPTQPAPTDLPQLRPGRAMGQRVAKRIATQLPGADLVNAERGHGWIARCIRSCRFESWIGCSSCGSVGMGEWTHYVRCAAATTATAGQMCVSVCVAHKHQAARASSHGSAQRAMLSSRQVVFSWFADRQMAAAPGCVWVRRAELAACGCCGRRRDDAGTR